MPIPYVWRFASQVTQPGIFITNTYSAAAFPGVEPGQKVEIQKARPVFRTEKAEFFNNNFDLIVVSSDDPNFEKTDQRTATHYEWDIPTQDKRTTGVNKIDDDGWVTYGENHLVGGFFKFLVAVHNVVYEWDRDAVPQDVKASEPVDFIKEFIGIELMFVVRGEF